jgi:hypothetical protein
MHPRLTGVLRTINPLVPSDATPEQAWKMIKPEGAAFLRPSFWWALGRSLRFAKTPARQVRVAQFIWNWKVRAELAGRPWPPIAIAVKPALVPQPHIN